MLPLIVIVGRPNVGKSTLFNRMIGRREALVSDLPGLTRDRREAEMGLAGTSVRLADTAGLEDAAPGSIAARMRAQTEGAIRDADLVLFLIDARAGITPTDEAFARLVRASGKPTILVANKCEGKQGMDGAYEAFALGLGDPVTISAEHGEGLGALLDDMAAALGFVAAEQTRTKGGRRAARAAAAAGAAAQADENEADGIGLDTAARPIRVAIVGRPNAGKSTLVNAILGEDRMITGPEPGLTRDAIATDLDWQGRRIRLFDTAGLRRKARVTEEAEKLATGDALKAIRFAEVVVLLIDAERPFEHQDLTIGDRVAEEGRALVIGINKWDAVEDKQALLKDLRETVREKLAQVEGVSLVTLSALSGRGVDKLMAAVIEAYEVWNRRVPTAELNRWLAAALERHSPPATRGRRLKLRFMTQPSARPPTFVAFCSHPGGIPGGYMRYLVNSLRERFNLPGVPIRIHLRASENPFADKD